MEDENIFIDDPKPLNPDLVNKFPLDNVLTISLDGNSKRNLYLSKFDHFLVYPSYSGSISLIDLSKNKIIWIYKHSKKINSGVSYGDSKIFFVDNEGYLIALSNNGELEWKSFVGEVFSPPLHINNGVVVKTSFNKFFCLNSIDGSLRWEYVSPHSPLPKRSWAELTLSDEILFSGASGGKVIALNSNTGSLLWESSFSPAKGSSELQRSNDTTSKVLADESVIYAISSQGNVAAIAKVDGVTLWSRALSSFNGMSLYENQLIITHNSGSVYALDKNTNKVMWRNNDLSGRDVSRPFIYNNLVVVSDYEGFIHFFDLGSGLTKARIKVAESTLLYPVIGNTLNDLIFASIDGELNFISAKNDDTNVKNKIIEDTSSVEIKDDQYSMEGSDMQNSKENSLLDTLFFWD